MYTVYTELPILASSKRGTPIRISSPATPPLHPPTPENPGPLRLETQMKPEDFTVRVPTLVIWGENDRALPKSLLDGLEEVVPGMRLERIPAGTHWVIHEQPQRINGLIRSFVA